MAGSILTHVRSPARSVHHFAKAVTTTVVILELVGGFCLCQIQAGVYDFGQARWGEKRGSWTPGEWLAGVLLIMTILLGLALSIGLCYYVNRNQAQKSASRLNFLKRQRLRMSQEQIEQVEEQQQQQPKRQPSLTSGRRSSLSFEQANNFERGQEPEQADSSLAYQDYYNDQRRLMHQHQNQQRQTPNASLVVQI